MNAHVQPIQPRARKELARHVGQESAFDVGAIIRVQAVDDLRAVRPVGHEGFEVMTFACKLFHRAHAGGLHRDGQGGQRIGDRSVRDKKFIGVHVD